MQEIVATEPEVHTEPVAFYRFGSA